MVVATIASSLAISSACSHAQEVSYAVNDRVAESGEPVVVVPTDEKPRSGVELAVLIAAAYDDNIFLSRHDAKSDMVGKVSPSIAYHKGDPKADTGAYIAFAYRPTVVMYADTSSENRIDHQLDLGAGWRGPLSKWSYRGSLEKLGDATADSGRPTDRINIENELRVGWIPRERITLEVAAGQKQTNYDDSAFYDSKKLYGEAAVRFAYSPKTEISLAYQVGRIEIDGASDQKSHQLVAGLDWRPREKIVVHLVAGAERRETDAGSDVNPVVEARVDWRPREGTSLYLAGYQRQETSAFLAGQNYQLKGFTAGVSQHLGSRWTAQLEGGRESASYSRASGSGDSGRHDVIWFIKPSLAYKLTDALDLSVFFRYNHDESSDSNFGFEQRMAGVEMNYRF